MRTKFSRCRVTLAVPRPKDLTTSKGSKSTPTTQNSKTGQQISRLTTKPLEEDIDDIVRNGATNVVVYIDSLCRAYPDVCLVDGGEGGRVDQSCGLDDA